MAAPRLRVPNSPPGGSMLARTAQQVSDEVELYHRTYTTLLRSSGETLLRVLEPSHRSMTSSLHALAGSEELDLGAFLYAIRRLPDEVAAARVIVMGQEVEVFARDGIGPLEDWTPLEAPARRRRWYDDGAGTMAVLLASTSDLDDLIPTMVAYQIEWNKLHSLLGHSGAADHSVDQLWRELDVREGDWQHFAEITGGLTGFLQTVAADEKDLRVRAVGGTHVGYARAVRRWWSAIHNTLLAEGLDQRPVYFVTSNTHSLVNLLSGVATRQEDQILRFVDESGDGELRAEREAIRSGASRASWANFLY
ncbi:MAG: DUF6909 family protein, partial [Burkholderiales bacterium]